MAIILEHREPSSAEARRNLYSVAAGVLTGSVLLCVLGPNVWADSPVLTGVSAGAFIAGCSLGLYDAVGNQLASEDFVCRLDHNPLQCSCPIGGPKLNFTVAIRDIVQIERQEWESGHDWKLIDQSGYHFCLTSGYRNPADRFVELIRELNPNIADVTT
ncbi:MAG: hypothetical protein ACYTGL_18750 [Planctomycetota bacterium]